MKDPKTEQFLDRGGWRWEYREGVPFAEIDIKTSRENPSRNYRILNEDVVENYMLAMAAGDVFPPLVLLTLDPATSPTFKYLIATGVHRVTAAQMCDKTAFDSYIVVEPDTYRRDLLCRQINTIEGHSVTLRDRVAQILHLAETYPDHTLKQLAQEWHINLSTIKLAAAEKAAITRAARFNYQFTGKQKISQRNLVALNGIHSDPVFQRALGYVVNHSPPAAEIDTMVKDIKKTRDEGAALAVVDRCLADATELQKRNKAVYGRSSLVPAAQFMSDAKRLNNTLAKGIESLHMATYPRRDHAAIIVEGLIEHLKRLSSELARIERMEKSGTARSGADARQAVH